MTPIGDGVKLYRDYGVVAANLVELGTLARQADQRFLDAFKRPMVSLAKCVAFYQHRTLDKGPVRTSNWEAELSCQQIECTPLRFLFVVSRLFVSD